MVEKVTRTRKKAALPAQRIASSQTGTAPPDHGEHCCLVMCYFAAHLLMKKALTQRHPCRARPANGESLRVFDLFHSLAIHISKRKAASEPLCQFTV